MKNNADYIEMKVPAQPEYVGIIRLTLSGSQAEWAIRTMKLKT